VSASKSDRPPHRRLYPLTIEAFTGICCIGRGRKQIADAIFSGACGLEPNDFGDAAADVDTCIGRVRGIEHEALPDSLAAWDCRDHRLSWAALQQDGFAGQVNVVAERFGAHRIGIFVGTSTAGILDTEELFRSGREGYLAPERFRKRHDLGSVSEFVATALRLSGPRMSVSTACSSSAKVFAAAARFVALGLCDATVVGGADSLCYSTLYGFKSLELLSRTPARPFARDRAGISIGEGAAFALLVRGGAAASALLGTGESSDGYHMSSPHPEGLGAERAMIDALSVAELRSSDIDYVNLHGTGTEANDAVEASTVSRLFGSRASCSSTKGATGHCLGAAGAIEALICDLALEYQIVPGNVGIQREDVAFPIDLAVSARPGRIERVLSNSFGFGGSNCSLILGRTRTGGSR
jgi:3-oxoacyl-[acyl-carrier-protein] synthase-1